MSAQRTGLLTTAVCLLVLCVAVANCRPHDGDDCCTQVLPSGISIRVTWRGVKCALGASPCNYGRKILYKTHHKWEEWSPQPGGIMMMNYGDDCEFILRDLPLGTRHLKIQLIGTQGRVLADTGELRPTYQTVYHPQFGTCDKRRYYN